MHDVTRRRTGQAVAVLLAFDGLLHLYWTTGRTWPASDERALSVAVLGSEVPFTPPVLLPLAALLLTAAAAVLGHGLDRGGPRTRRLLRIATLAVAAGLLTRGVAGLGWAVGLGDVSGPAFRLLNPLLYTPVCLGFGVATARLAGVGDRRGPWLRGTDRAAGRRDTRGRRTRRGAPSRPAR